jgi:hypothetical protein
MRKFITGIVALALGLALAGFLPNNIQTPQVPKNKFISLGGAINTPITVYAAAGTATFTGSISGATLNVISGLSGTIGLGQQVTGTGVTSSATGQFPIITAFGTGTGGVGTYFVSVPQTVASTSMSAFGNGAKLTGCDLSTSDTSAHVVTISINGVPQTSFSVGATPTSNFFVSNNCFAPQNWAGLPVDASGNSYVVLQPGDLMTMQFATVLGGGTLQSGIYVGE